MPVTFDFNKNELFGPIYRKGLAEGREEAYREVLTRQLTARFGDLPSWVHDRIQVATDPELEDLATRLLKAESLAALFER